MMIRALPASWPLRLAGLRARIARRWPAPYLDPRRTNSSFSLRNSLVLALLLSWVLYDLILESGLAHDGRAYAVLVGPTWIQRSENFFFLWGIVILVFKVLIFRLNAVSLKRAAVPIAGPILSPPELRVLGGLYACPKAGHGLFAHRVSTLIRQHDTGASPPEMRETGRSLAESDLDGLESSYIYLRYFVWAIPILGFIGTVVGVSDAIASFNVDLSKIRNVDEVRKALGGVTAGLAVAFNTTYLALGLSLLLMFGMTALQKIEQDLLADIDRFVERWLIQRLPR